MLTINKDEMIKLLAEHTDMTVLVEIRSVTNRYTAFYCTLMEFCCEDNDPTLKTTAEAATNYKLAYDMSEG